MGVDLRQGRHVAPEFFELGDGEDVFLSVAPALFDFLQRDIGRHPCREGADSGGDFFSAAGPRREVGAGEGEGGEELVEVDPGGEGIVIGQGEFGFLAGHGETFDQPGTAVDAGEAAAAVLEAAGDDFEGEGRAAFEVLAEQGGIDIGSEGVDVMQQQGFQLRALAEEFCQGAVAQEVGDFIPMADGVQALQREVVGVVAGFAGAGGPADQGGAQAVADLLLLLVQHLLGHFLPRETEVAFGGHHAQADAFAGAEQERALIVIVGALGQEVLGGAVGEETGGEEMGDGRAVLIGDAAALGEVGFEEGAVAAPKFGEGVQGFADARPLGPAGTGSGGEGDHSDAAGLQGGFPLGFEIRDLRFEMGGVLDVGGEDVFDGGVGGEAVLRETDAAIAEVGTDLFVLGGVKAVFGEQGAQGIIGGTI